jgi:hypothetical protein
MREHAKEKAEQRIKQGLVDFENDPASFVPRTIGGRQALSWSAKFTRGNQPWAEYFTLARSENGVATFFVQAPMAVIGAIRPKVESMVESVRLP